MIDLSAEWALVVATIGLVAVTIGLVVATFVLVGATKALTNQARRQAEIHKVQIAEDALARGRGEVQDRLKGM